VAFNLEAGDLNLPNLESTNCPLPNCALWRCAVFDYLAIANQRW
jgi:hypothetical protein